MMTFRTATPDDVPAVTRLVNSAYRGETSRRGWTTEADFLGGQRTDEELVLGMISAADSRIELACQHDGSLVGCMYLRRESAGFCYLGMLTVEPTRQAAGLGRRMLEHAEAVAKAWGSHSMRMTVIDRRHELLAYYERRGYRNTGVSHPFPEDDPRFGLPTVRGLRFVELVKPLA